MEKKLKSEVVFRKENKSNPIKFCEIDIKLEPNDVIHAGHDEGFYSENDSWDAHYFLEIQRDRLETDEEFEERKGNDEFFKKHLKEKRYENYLKLKKEFENDDKIQS